MWWEITQSSADTHKERFEAINVLAPGFFGPYSEVLSGASLNTLSHSGLPRRLRNFCPRCSAEAGRFRARSDFLKAPAASPTMMV